jgi:hypothetical protein
MTDEIKRHPNFNADDYAYLAAKGWSDAEIVARWNTESGPCRWDTDAAKAKLASTLRAANAKPHGER